MPMSSPSTAPSGMTIHYRAENTSSTQWVSKESLNNPDVTEISEMCGSKMGQMDTGFGKCFHLHLK